MLNKAILMGRLTRDPELRHTQSNMAVCSFSLAIDRGRKDQNGERQTDFIDCVAWGRQAEFVAQWFTKGSMAIVVGRIQSRRWQDQNGNNRTAIEIVASNINFVTPKSQNPAAGMGAPMATTQAVRAVLPAAMIMVRRCGPSLPRPRLLRLSISLQEIRIFRSSLTMTAMSHSNLKEVT